MKNVLRIRKYNSFGGTEFFISIESVDEVDLYGFIRLRMRFKDDEVIYKELHDSEKDMFQFDTYNVDEYLEDSYDILENFPVLKNSALVRELHIYGTVVPHYFGDNEKDYAVQHRGFGKCLLKAAEYLSYAHGFSRIVVISGVGVREYYANNGYTLQETYMVKNIIDQPSIPNEFDIDFLDCDLETDLFKTLRYIKSLESNRANENDEIQNIPGLSCFRRIKLEEYLSGVNNGIYDHGKLEFSEQGVVKQDKDRNNLAIKDIVVRFKQLFYGNKVKNFYWMFGISIFASSIFGLNYLNSKRRK